MNKHVERMNPSRLAWGSLVGAVLLVVAGCGGGGGGSGSPNVTVSTTVVDGILSNALVCLDRNGNGECDAGEEQGLTNAAGVVTLSLPRDVVNLYPLVAVARVAAAAVPASPGVAAVPAVPATEDADHGTVTTAYSMVTPAGSTGVISPLTTMVHVAAQTNGVSTAEAEKIVKEATGLSGSVMGNFIASGDTTATAVARVIVVATQAQTTSLASTVGTAASDSSAITWIKLDRAIKNRLLAALPKLAEVTTNAAYPANGTSAEKLVATNNALAALTPSLLSTSTVALEVAINNQVAAPPAATASAPAAGYSLRHLVYTDANNKAITLSSASLAQATPDAAGTTRYVDRRYQQVAGVGTAWNVGGEPRYQAELSFNGSTWVACALNHEGTTSVADSLGYTTGNYCNSREISKATNVSFDISGRTMTSVLADLAAAAPDDWQISSAGSALLGSATFPTGSFMRYRNGSTLSTAPTYYPGTDNIVTSSPASVGGDGRVSGNVCSTSQTNAAITSLEDLVAHMTGTPCTYSQQTLSGTSFTSDSPRTQWGSTTVSLGTVGTVNVNGTPTAYYTGNKRIRVAFTGGSATRYYECKESFGVSGNGGTSQSCVAIGTGTYSIASVGDARVMGFTSLPGALSARSSNRVFVERGGQVYFGYQTKLNTFSRPRLGTTAANALLTQLGMDTIDANVPLALTATSYQGSWVARDVSAPTAFGTLITLAPNGIWSCLDLSNNTSFSCAVAITNPATGATAFTDNTNGSYSTATLNFMTGLGSGSNFLQNGTPDGASAVVRR